MPDAPWDAPDDITADDRLEYERTMEKDRADDAAKALSIWGRHLPSCHAQKFERAWAKCSCGFDKALLRALGIPPANG